MARQRRKTMRRGSCDGVAHDTDATTDTSSSSSSSAEESAEESEESNDVDEDYDDAALSDDSGSVAVDTFLEEVDALLEGAALERGGSGGAACKRACGSAASMMRARNAAAAAAETEGTAQAETHVSGPVVPSSSSATAVAAASVPSVDAVVAAALVLGCSVTAAVTRLPPNTIRYFAARTAFPRFRSDTVAFCQAHTDMLRAPLLLCDARASHQHVTFKVHKAVRHSCVLGTLRRAGLKETKKSAWNVCWGKRIKDAEYLQLNPYQKINHFPGTWNLGRKDALVRGLGRMRRRHGETYDIMPHTFLLPHDASLLESEMRACPGAVFIVKPPASSCGKGIYLINSLSDVPKTSPCLVQRYITNPLTVRGYKCDLRLYVAVTSFNPLKIYIFHDGLCRFATEPYRRPTHESQLSNRFMHLTNYSVNKKSAKFQRNTSAAQDDSGSKWSMRGLRRYLCRMGHDWDATWWRIKDVVTKTFLSCEGTVVSKLGMFVKSRGTCFELYGFDILLTSQLVPYLLEVNIMPALCCSSPLDRQIKTALISDLLNLVGLQAYDRNAYSKEAECRKKARILGFSTGDTTTAAATSAAASSPAEPGGGPKSNNIGFSSEASKGARRWRTRSLSSGGGTSNGLSDTDSSLSGSTGASVRAADERSRANGGRIDFASLGAFELEVLRDSEDEYFRRGGFERVFPTRVSCEHYGSFFETTRYCNALLGQWEKEKARCAPEDRRMLLAWLQGSGPYPGRPAAPVSSGPQPPPPREVPGAAAAAAAAAAQQQQQRQPRSQSVEAAGGQGGRVRSARRCSTREARRAQRRHSSGGGGGSGSGGGDDGKAPREQRGEQSGKAKQAAELRESRSTRLAFVREHERKKLLTVEASRGTVVPTLDEALGQKLGTAADEPSVVLPLRKPATAQAVPTSSRGSTRESYPWAMTQVQFPPPTPLSARGGSTVVAAAAAAATIAPTMTSLC